MGIKLSDEEMNVIEKFGFRFEGETVIHKKMDIHKEIESFQGFSSLDRLEEYIKSLLVAT